MKEELYDKEYFEIGLETGKSCYQNYRWIPFLTIPFVMNLIDAFSITRHHSILDFGCAKGFVVRAFHLLHRTKTYGVDISSYALSQAPEEIKPFLFKYPNLSPTFYDFCLAKDVFEHIPFDKLPEVLYYIYSQCDKLFVIVPLGKNGKFYSKMNDLDPTHVSCYNETEWVNIFLTNGWKVIWRRFEFYDVKKDHSPKSHGFFYLGK